MILRAREFMRGSVCGPSARCQTAVQAGCRERARRTHLDTAPLRCHLLLVEKRTPHYRLESIKTAFAMTASLRMTKTARDTAFALGLLLADVVRIIQGITRKQFYKSMTSLADHRIWQDVYHVPVESTVLYVKFTTDAQGYLVISFKEK